MTMGTIYWINIDDETWDWDLCSIRVRIRIGNGHTIIGIDVIHFVLFCFVSNLKWI